MSDSQEYRRKLASGQDMAATTQEYKMAQDRETVLKYLNQWKDDEAIKPLTNAQVVEAIRKRNPNVSYDTATKLVNENRQEPSGNNGGTEKRSEAEIRRDMNEEQAKGGNTARMKELEAEMRGSEINLPEDTEKNTAANSTAASTTDSQPQSQENTQNQGQTTSNWYTQYYGNDIHKNGATPFNGGKKKEDEGEGDEKDRTGSLKRFSLLGNVFGARNPNNVLFDRRDMMRNLADEATNEAATHGMEAQGWQQIANRNPYSEASKYASATNAQQIAANVTANSAKGGDQIGLSRVNNPMDINTQDQKAMDARLKAETPRQKQLNAQGQSTAYLGEAQQLNTQGNEMSADRAESNRLSLGNGTGTSTGEGETKEKTEETTEETPAEENQPEPAPEPQLTEAEVHQILNYVTYGNDPTSPQNHFDKLNDAQKSLWKSWGSPQPLTEQEASKYTGIPADGKGKGFGTNAQLGVMQTAVRELRPEYWEKQKQAESERKLDTPEQNNSMTQEQLKGMTTQVQQYACGTKNAKPGYAIVGENGPEIVKMNGGEVVIPNNDDIDRIVSDERIKLIKEILDMGLGMSDEDFNWLVKKQGGKFNFNGKEYDWYKKEDWANDNDDSVLKGYADHIKNYLYTYKPEAQKIDKSIDPEQEHIGPMAQDIEKVNPACIVETPEGVKTVDTGRLAMMNAGAIGDLARQLRELKEVFING